jgi:hypothetical protein
MNAAKQIFRLLGLHHEGKSHHFETLQSMLWFNRRIEYPRRTIKSVRETSFQVLQEPHVAANSQCELRTSTHPSDISFTPRQLTPKIAKETNLQFNKHNLISISHGSVSCYMFTLTLLASLCPTLEKRCEYPSNSVPHKGPAVGIAGAPAGGL